MRPHARSLPLSIIIALGLLYREIGAASFTGVFLFVLTSPLSGIVMKQQFEYQKKTVEARDGARACNPMTHDRAHSLRRELCSLAAPAPLFDPLF
jgi:hypothetical protein